MHPLSAISGFLTYSTKLSRRLSRCMRDRRYRLLYVDPYSPDECCYILQGRFLTADLSAAPDVARDVLRREVVGRFLDEIAPHLEWTDWVGNCVFWVACWAVLVLAGSKTWIAAPFQVVVLVCAALRLIRAGQQVPVWKHWTARRSQARAQPDEEGSPR